MSEAYERIDESNKFDGRTRDSHEIRYRIARQLIKDGDTALDAGCGSGYGRKILMEGLTGAHYAGCDKRPPALCAHVDFETGEGFGEGFSRVPEFDVFVGFEVIEHLNDAGVARFVELAKHAKKYIAVSTPIKPNSNPFHKQHFKPHEIMEKFIDESWQLYSYIEQDQLYGVFIYKRK